MMQADTYYSYQFGGMHVLWWIIWMILLIWIFAVPYNIPGQKRKKETPIDILKVRFALGEIDEEEFESKKQLLNTI